MTPLPRACVHALQASEMRLGLDQLEPLIDAHLQRGEPDGARVCVGGGGAAGRAGGCEAPVGTAVPSAVLACPPTTCCPPRLSPAAAPPPPSPPCSCLCLPAGGGGAQPRRHGRLLPSV
jgi:hypothetical protein